LKRRTNQRSRESGQALLELALIVPILILIIMAVFQFAFVLESQMGLTNAVREAARRAASTTNPTSAWVQDELCGNPACDDGLLADNVQGFNPGRLAAAPTVNFCTYLVAGTPNYRVDVSLTYDHPVFFGPIAFATDVADGTSDGDWTLAATAQMRLERGVPNPAPAACPS
jgi:Flp pilus assembly protein TadG